MSRIFDSEFLAYFPILESSGYNITDVVYADEMVNKINQISLSDRVPDVSTVEDLVTMKHTERDSDKENNASPFNQQYLCPNNDSSSSGCSDPELAKDYDIPVCELVEDYCEEIQVEETATVGEMEHSVLVGKAAEFNVIDSSQCNNCTFDAGSVMSQKNTPSKSVPVDLRLAVYDDGNNDTFLDDEVFMRTQSELSPVCAPKAPVRYTQLPLVFAKSNSTGIDVIESKSRTVHANPPAPVRLSSSAPPRSENGMSEQSRKCTQLIECSQAIKACPHPLAVVPYHYQGGPDDNLLVQSRNEHTLPLLIETLVHLDNRKGDRGARALFLSGSSKQDRLHGGILIVTQKQKLVAWASLIKNIADVTLHVQGSLSLQQRRKNGAEKLARHDVVLTTYDVLRAKEVAAPVPMSTSTQHSSQSSGRNGSSMDESSTHSTLETDSRDSRSDADFLSPLAKTSRKVAGVTPECSLLHLIKWNYILTDDAPSSGLNIKLSTVKGAAVKALQHAPSRTYNARDSGTSIPRMFCLFPSQIPTHKLIPELLEGSSQTSLSGDDQLQLSVLLSTSSTYVAPLLQLHRISGEQLQEAIVVLPQPSKTIEL